MLLSCSDTKRILVYKFRSERTVFNMFAEYTRTQLTFLALVPWMLPSSCNRTIDVKWPSLEGVTYTIDNVTNKSFARSNMNKISMFFILKLTYYICNFS